MLVLCDPPRPSDPSDLDGALAIVVRAVREGPAEDAERIIGALDLAKGARMLATAAVTQQATNDGPDEYLKAKEAAKFIGMSESYVRHHTAPRDKLARPDDLPTARRGGAVRYGPMRELDKWRKKRETRA